MVTLRDTEAMTVVERRRASVIRMERNQRGESDGGGLLATSLEWIAAINTSDDGLLRVLLS